MRIAIVTESFLPNINGVTNTVIRIAEYAQAHNHELLIIAPTVVGSFGDETEFMGFPVIRVTALKVPKIDSLPVGAPSPRVYTALKKFNPDIVHLASPFVLGSAGVAAASALGMPCVGVYQTDVVGFSEGYGFGILSEVLWSWTRGIHNRCDRNLVPSSASAHALRTQGIRNIHRWGRGVDTTRFHPRKRSPSLRELWSPQGKTIIGTVCRLAPEKHVERLATLQHSQHADTTQIVVVGDGPQREELAQQLPNAIFTGQLGGEELAQAYASFDVFIHTGEFETFCQTIQEAQASGLPVIAPAAGGPLDLVTPGTGHLFDVPQYARDIPDYLTTILSSLDSYQLASRKRVEDITWDAVCGQLFDHYQEVLHQREYQHAAAS